MSVTLQVNEGKLQRKGVGSLNDSSVGESAKLSDEIVGRYLLLPS